jgi:hypothetical protein
MACISCTSLFQCGPDHGQCIVTAEVGTVRNQTFEVGISDNTSVLERIHEVLEQRDKGCWNFDLEKTPKKNPKYTFKKLCIGLAFGALLVCSKAPPVSGSLGRRWSSVWRPAFPKITFSELRECALDVVCATPIACQRECTSRPGSCPRGWYCTGTRGS